MSSVIKLGISTGNQSLPMINESELNPIYDKVYSTAAHHWIFGGSESDSLLDIINSKLINFTSTGAPLLVNDSSVAFNVSYATQGILNTNIMDAGDHTFIVAFKCSPDSSGTLGIAGNYKGSTGVQLFQSGDNLIPRALPNNFTLIDVNNTHNVKNTWYVVGITVNNNQMKVAWSSLSDTGYREDELATPRAIGTLKPYHIGWHGDNTGAFTENHEFAEFLFFENQLSLSDLKSQVSNMYSRITSKGLV